MDRRPPVRRAAPPALGAPRLARSRFEDFDVDDSAETQVFQSMRRRGGALRVPPSPASSSVLRGPARAVALQSGDFETVEVPSAEAPTTEVATAVRTAPPLPQMVPPALESTPAVALSFDALQPAPVPSELEAASVGRSRGQRALRWVGAAGLGVVAVAAAALIGFAVWRAPAPEVAAFVSNEEAPAPAAPPALPVDALPVDALPVDALPVDALPVDALPVDEPVLEPSVEVSDAMVAEAPAVVSPRRASAPRKSAASSSKPVASSAPASKPASASKPSDGVRGGESSVVTAKATARQASRVLDDAL